MIKQRIQYIRSKFRYDTFMQILLDAFKMLKIRINPYYIFLEGIKLTPSGLEIRKPEDIEFSFLQKENMPMILDFPDRNESLKTLNQRLEHGDICIAAWHKGIIIAFSWANLSELSFRPYNMPLSGNEAYLYDAYTAPEFRGKRIADVLRYQLYTGLAEQGRHVLFSVSQRYNPPAIRFKTKLGAKIVDNGFSITFFGRWEFKTPTHAQKIRASV